MSNTSVASCSLAQHRVPRKLDNNLVAIQYDHMTTHLNLLICQSLTNANVSPEGGTQCTDACHASLLENTPQVASAAHINDWDPSKFGLGMLLSGFQLLQHFFMFLLLLPSWVLCPRCPHLPRPSSFIIYRKESKLHQICTSEISFSINQTRPPSVFATVVATFRRLLQGSHIATRLVKGVLHLVESNAALPLR